MTICLENGPQIPGPQRLDTVWTLRNHQGKPNARKVRMWNPQHLQMHLGLRRLRLTSQQMVKGLAPHPSSLKTVCSERGSARWSGIPQDLFTRPLPFEPRGFEAKIGKKEQIEELVWTLSHYREKRQLYSLRGGEEKVSHCRMENPPRPRHPRHILERYVSAFTTQPWLMSTHSKWQRGKGWCMSLKLKLWYFFSLERREFCSTSSFHSSLKFILDVFPVFFSFLFFF